MTLDDMVQTQIDGFGDKNLKNGLNDKTLHDSPILMIQIKSHKPVTMTHCWKEIIDSGNYAVDPKISNIIEQLYVTYKQERDEELPNNFAISELNEDQLKSLYGDQRSFLENCFPRDTTKKVGFPYTVFLHKARR